MSCERCGTGTHLDDSSNRRCNSCERIVRQCNCRATEIPEETKFLVGLMGAAHAQTNAAANDVIAGLQREADDLREIIINVRTRLDKLFSGPYMPSQAAIDSAVTPLYGVPDIFWRDRDNA